MCPKIRKNCEQSKYVPKIWERFCDLHKKSKKLGRSGILNSNREEKEYAKTAV